MRRPFAGPAYCPVPGVHENDIVSHAGTDLRAERRDAVGAGKLRSAFNTPPVSGVASGSSNPEKDLARSKAGFPRPAGCSRVDFRVPGCLFALTRQSRFAFSTSLPPVPTSRVKRPAPARPAAAYPASAVVDQGFIAARAKLIDVAAFLDRVERHAAAEDFRCAALREAAALLVDGRPERARRILEKLSDPTTEPANKSSGKAALGAWRRPASSSGPGRPKKK